jgi:hypothetical protein
MSAKAPSAVVLNVTEKYIFVQGEVRNPTRGCFYGEKAEKRRRI